MVAAIRPDPLASVVGAGISAETRGEDHHGSSTEPRSFPRHVPRAWRPRVAPDGYYHPSTEAEVVAIVDEARREGRSVRVRGSAHSVASAIETDARRTGRSSAFDVMLDRLGRVTIDTPSGRVVAEAGCHLGVDPRDPTGLSTGDRALLPQLRAQGLALPDLGGVTHQTIAGFLLTGSAGGSLAHSNEQCIEAIRFVDGRARLHEIASNHPWFDAIVCSMGLLGVITAVAFRAVPAYDVRGDERVLPDDAPEPGLRTRNGLSRFLRESEYARLIWWPQPGVRRVTTWRAHRMGAADYDAETGPARDLVERPYRVMGHSLRSKQVANAVSFTGQWLGGAFYRGISALEELEGRHPILPRLRRSFAPGLAPRMVAGVLDAFVPLDKGEPQRFWGRAENVLPLDEGMSARALPTTFTELWLPLEAADEVMATLHAHFDRGLTNTGTFAWEVYGARATRGWLHPAYERDSLRIDPFWFASRADDPAARGGLFDRLWRLLQPFGYRLHWGKWLPREEELGAGHLRASYPRWDDFMALRRELDPDGIFLTHAWRRALGVVS